MFNLRAMEYGIEFPAGYYKAAWWDRFALFQHGASLYWVIEVLDQNYKKADKFNI